MGKVRSRDGLSQKRCQQAGPITLILTLAFVKNAATAEAELTQAP